MNALALSVLFASFGAPADSGAAVATALLRDVYQRQDLGAARARLAPGYLHRTTLARGVLRVGGFVRRLEKMYAGMAQLRLVIHQVFPARDRVAVHWTLRFLHRGDLLGMPATSRRITMTGVSLFRLAHGKILEHLEIVDQFRLLQQLSGLGPRGDR